MLSEGMFASLAASIAARRRALPAGSPPPSRAATVSSLMILLKSLPLVAPIASFLCLIFDHRLWPDMGPPIGTSALEEGAGLGGDRAEEHRPHRRRADEQRQRAGRHLRLRAPPPRARAVRGDLLRRLDRLGRPLRREVVDVDDRRLRRGERGLRGRRRRALE